jgi:hypothetical protein
VLLLDERILANGRHVRTWARAEGDRVRIADDGEVGAVLSLAALDRVMVHFGKPLEAGIALDGDALALGDRTLRRLRFHAIVDATGRDYLVWERPGEEPLVVLATTVTAALRYLVLRLSQETEM